MLPARPGDALRVVFEDGHESAATLLRQSAKRLVLRLMHAPGDPTPPGSIYWDPGWIVRRLGEHVSVLDLTPVTLSALGHQPLHPRLTQLPVLAHDALDAEQSRILSFAVDGPYTAVVGPPGTGKTRLVAHTILELRARGESVLVVTPSNRTADLIVMRLLPFAEDLGSMLGNVVRLGTVQAPELVELASQPERLWSEPRIHIVDGSDADAANKAIKRADVLITTLPRTWTTGGFDRRFDSVLVDEASMALVPAVVAAFGHAAERGIVYGDPCQLGPIVHSRSPLSDRWLRRCVFDLSDRGRAAPVVALRTQYRMRPSIADLVSDLSYRGMVRTSPEVLTRPFAPSTLGDDEMFLVDTSALSGGGTLENPAHAHVAAALADLLRPLDSEERTGSVALISRFRRQVSITRRAIRENCRHPSSAVASTVHSFQGSEADAVVFDLCASPGSYLGDYLVDAHVRSDGGRLLTVALSRARERLAVIANVGFLTRSRTIPESAASRRMLRLLLDRATVIPAREVLALHRSLGRHRPDDATHIRLPSPIGYGD
ncbi:MAG TPA: AAA domain-containing protein [Bryobacteraceae bacterium]|nr:AAA domain-containing protein [Bryobacteraceae bacterium]